MRAVPCPEPGQYSVRHGARQCARVHAGRYIQGYKERFGGPLFPVVNQSVSVVSVRFRGNDIDASTHRCRWHHSRFRGNDIWCINHGHVDGIIPAFSGKASIILTSR